MFNRRLLPTLLGLLIVLALIALRIADPYPLQVARDTAFDTFQRIKPRTGPAGPVRVVDIDEASLKTLGQWPWPRDRIALLTDRLTQLGAVGHRLRRAVSRARPDVAGDDRGAGAGSRCVKIPRQ